MQHKGFDAMQCPIARSLERVGEWWSILILRDAFKGVARFDQFQKSLGIAPNMLTRRLNTLVDSGLLERRLYSEKPPRHEYVLTARGRDFRPVLWALVSWGNKHFPPEGNTMVVVDAETGEQADPVLVDSRSGRVLQGPEFKVTSVPVADVRAQLESVAAGSAKTGSALKTGRSQRVPVGGKLVSARGGPKSVQGASGVGEPKSAQGAANRSESKLSRGAPARAKRKKVGVSS
jgi:DNA-binding HxlR family transcriptional regulator